MYRKILHSHKTENFYKYLYILDHFQAIKKICKKSEVKFLFVIERR